MPERQTYTCFFSYSHRDAIRDPALLSAFTKDLEARVNAVSANANFKIWRDDDGLRAGNKWDKALASAIRASDMMIVLLTSAWIDSEYCRKEYVVFEQHALDREVGEFVLPILASNFEIQETHFTHEQNEVYQRLLTYQYRKILSMEFFKLKTASRTMFIDKLGDDIDIIIQRLGARTRDVNVNDQNTPGVPNQSPAPVKVTARDGKIVQTLLGDSSLRSTVEDFNEWHDFVIDHVKELTHGDFRAGTNHGRVRDRLVALERLLSGVTQEIKNRQFYIGYEIERFDGVVTAYKVGGGDMPILNAAVLEDLIRLTVALKLGRSKLERWFEFQQSAMDDPLDEGRADRNKVGRALDEIAETMEERDKYFAPELPASFRFLAESVKDPVGATRAVVYGAVKSVENLISFLGQKALGIGQKATDALESNISKAVATSLLLGLGGAALQVSGALPAHWAWLKPLLDGLSKAGIGP
jgi:TIR domain-containing protein